MSNKIVTDLWKEIPEPENPFRPSQCLCAGFDVYGELVPQISWTEYVLLLFLKQQPEGFQVDLLNALAVALGNPGPRDQSVHAAMAAGAGGAGAAASLIAALAVGAGQLGGAREIAVLMEGVHQCKQDLNLWLAFLQPRPGSTAGEQANFKDVWPVSEHAPGFDPHAVATGKTATQTLDYLESCYPGFQLTWLKQNKDALENAIEKPISMAFVAASGFADLGLDEEQAEVLYLLIRLSGAAVHGLEQRWRGWREFPFYGNNLKVTNTKD